MIMRATSKLISTETTTVKPNALKYWPAIPGISATGQENRDDRHGRRKHGEADLVRRVERGLIGGFAHAHVPDDVLDLDDRVIDQHAGDEAHRHRRHEVERDPEHAHEPEGRDRRQRDRERGNHRRADVAKEQQNDEDGEDRALDQAFHRRAVLRLGVVDGVEDLGEAGPSDSPSRASCSSFHGIVVGGDFGRALGALDHEGDDLAAVHLGDRALLAIAVLDLAEIGEPDEAAAGKRDLRLRQLVGVPGVAEHAHGLLGTGDLGAAAGAVHVALAKLLIDLRGGDALRLQCRRIEDHADVPVDAADAADRGDALEAEQRAWRRYCRCTSSAARASCRWSAAPT